MTKMTIHFICSGNAHRSIMAEAYLKSLGLSGIKVTSSGSAADLYRNQNEPRIPRIVAILAKHGVAQFAKTYPEQITQERVDNANINICMNQNVVDECYPLITLPANTQTWDIDDVGEGHYTLNSGEDPLKYTEEIYQKIVKRVDELIKELKTILTDIVLTSITTGPSR